LQLAVALRRRRVRLPIALLVIGVGLAPFAPAVADNFGVLGISSDSLAVIFGPPPFLAFRPTAHALLGMEFGGLERLRTKAATSAQQAGIPPNRSKLDPSRKPEYRSCYRVPYRVPARAAVRAPPLGGGALFHRVHQGLGAV
jgi:hypothetical protein